VVGEGSSADQSSPPERDGSGDRSGFEGVGPSCGVVRADQAGGAGGFDGTGGWAGAGGVWEAGGAPADEAVGRRGFEARRASVLMHPPFPRTGLSAAPELGEPFRMRARGSPRARIPAPVDRHPGQGPPGQGRSSLRPRHSTG
jgi:hypothetical protein